MILVAFEAAVAIDFCCIIVTSGFEVQNIMENGRPPDYLECWERVPNNVYEAYFLHWTRQTDSLL